VDCKWVRVAEPCIEVRELTKTFGDLVAVDRLSLQVARGSSFAFYGPAGSGKSTLIRILLGVLAPTSGSGSVLGFDIGSQAALIRSRVGYMSQKFSLYEDLSVMENMRFFAGIFGLSKARAESRTQTLLDLCNLRGHEQSVAFHLNGGMRQRLSFAVSLIHDPDLVVLDDPGPIDPVLRRCFWDIIQCLSQAGKTVVMTTRSLCEARRCESIGLLVGGRLVAVGSPAKFLSQAFQGAMFEFSPTERELALHWLRSQSVEWISPTAPALRFVAPATSQAGLEQGLREQRLITGSLNVVEPTLDEASCALQTPGRQEDCPPSSRTP
jgi:ABC-2 type transport system ATP-binding protein